MAECGKGWAIRCQTAIGDKCSCSCGGENHGKFRKHLIPNKEITDFHVNEGGINFFIKFDDVVDLATLRIDEIMKADYGGSDDEKLLLCGMVQDYVNHRKLLIDGKVDKETFEKNTRKLRKVVPMILIKGYKGGEIK